MKIEVVVVNKTSLWWNMIFGQHGIQIAIKFIEKLPLIWSMFLSDRLVIATKEATCLILDSLIIFCGFFYLTTMEMLISETSSKWKMEFWKNFPLSLSNFISNVFRFSEWIAEDTCPWYCLNLTKELMRQRMKCWYR